jgi:hypothetical protein
VFTKVTVVLVIAASEMDLLQLMMSPTKPPTGVGLTCAYLQNSRKCGISLR